MVIQGAVGEAYSEKADKIREWGLGKCWHGWKNLWTAPKEYRQPRWHIKDNGHMFWLYVFFLRQIKLNWMVKNCKKNDLFCGFPVEIAVQFKKCLFFYPIKNIVIHVCGNCQGFNMFVKGEMEQGRVTKGIHLKKNFLHTQITTLFWWQKTNIVIQFTCEIEFNNAEINQIDLLSTALMETKLKYFKCPSV